MVSRSAKTIFNQPEHRLAGLVYLPFADSIYSSTNEGKIIEIPLSLLTPDPNPSHTPTPTPTSSKSVDLITSIDDTRFCISSQGNVWVCSSAQDLLFEVKLHNSPIIGISSYKSFLISASEDSKVRSYDEQAKTSKELYSHITNITAFDLHSSGLVATTCSDKVLKVFNLETNKTLDCNLKDKVWSLKFVSNKFLAIGDQSGVLTVVSCIKLDEVKFCKKLHEERIKHLALSPDRKMLATSSFDCVSRVLETVNFEELHVIKSHKDWVRCTVFSRDSRKLFSYADDGQIIQHWLCDEVSESRFRNYFVLALLVAFIAMLLFTMI